MMQAHLNKLIRRFSHITVCMLLCSVASPNVYGADDPVIPSPIAIVVHESTGVSNLSLDELRSIFLADQQFWSDRTRIILLVRAPQSDERDFTKCPRRSSAGTGLQKCFAQKYQEDRRLSSVRT